MNKFVKHQLSKCRIVIPHFTDDTTHLVIPYSKATHSTIEQFNPNSMFTIHIKDYIINEPSNFTLSSNWNGGTKPPEHQMQVKMLETRGKMVKVGGNGATTNIYWEGWLPQKGFDIE